MPKHTRSRSTSSNPANTKKRRRKRSRSKSIASSETIAEKSVISAQKREIQRLQSKINELESKSFDLNMIKEYKEKYETEIERMKKEHQRQIINLTQNGSSNFNKCMELQQKIKEQVCFCIFFYLDLCFYFD